MDSPAPSLRVLSDDDLIKEKQGGPPETKPEAMRRVREVFARYRTHVEVRNDEIVASGDIAYTRGVLRVTLESRDGDDRQELGRRYLEIWRKRGGASQQNHGQHRGVTHGPDEG